MRTCRICQKEFEIGVPVSCAVAKFITVCPECSEKQAIKDGEDLKASNRFIQEENWKRICPPVFQDTKPHLLPSPTKLQKVLQWQYGPKGLILHGETGFGKSRCAWELAKREFIAGKMVSKADASSGYEYASSFSSSAQNAADWIRRHSVSDLLLLDDVFKVKLTESFEQALFVIVNTRVESKLPIIATTNDTGPSLLNRMSDDRGKALIRRLCEFCETISFELKVESHADFQNNNFHSSAGELQTADVVALRQSNAGELKCARN